MIKNTILIQETDFNKIRKKIKDNPKKKIIFSSENDELNRKVIEKEKINVLLLNLSGKKDRFKQRDSGFNQVLAKLAKKKNITIGINLDEILEVKGENKKDILARIKQNIKLCNKNKLKMYFIALKKENKRDIYDLKALGLVLGMPTWMTKDIGKFF
jgi:RNase P/RNase MRP subunit p30